MVAIRAAADAAASFGLAPPCDPSERKRNATDVHMIPRITAAKTTAIIWVTMDL
jgi:hypothetical protein